MTRLSLLSGGEKALGAISFLFALFLARPCPFYLLDEVEAALDDTNIGRFVELLRRYADRAQFIVDHAPEADDGGRGRPLRRDDGRATASRRSSRGACRAKTRPRRAYGACPGRRVSAVRLAVRAPWLASWSRAASATENAGEPEPEADRARASSRRLRDSLAKSRRALTAELARPPSTRATTPLGAARGGADPRRRRRPGDRRARRGGSRRGGELADLSDGAGGGDRRAARRSRATLDRRRASRAVVLVVGVNGTGKTTTIGKLARSALREHGHSVVVAAADTFRAAAEEQLEIWARARRRRRSSAASAGRTRPPSPTTRSSARARDGRDVVIVDTAGRLHTQTNLMEELAKVRRVIAARLEGAPHETLLVVDATTGQNGLQQARLFGEAVGVTGRRADEARRHARRAASRSRSRTSSGCRSS